MTNEESVYQEVAEQESSHRESNELSEEQWQIINKYRNYLNEDDEVLRTLFDLSSMKGRANTTAGLSSDGFDAIILC
ncbi:hypothetical protein GUITHDRAFT_156473 [Guillardia theta CCMP2712]|uniref:Uncharacterized protein n=1 Tax=Guillardia theta (strain CCMP2712) TaxID=905079 RepID=L1I7J7_GUITC|nr:hypothetical protein GUITHDRAFT_156473 [Guillardia theta CCMP2712]EKX31854.1 hypothetical protein GUITHDRAFT_156473 [Guillardia theta CCMP2712]|eukprot:XP_005818834.1 hypothetical protein GUITHDRAFT_156473 [Guillardia theta CCMP2712]